MWFVLAFAIQLIIVSTAEQSSIPSCDTANWWVSLDRPIWSVCPKTNTYLKGFWRSAKVLGDERMGRLEEGKCCEAYAPNYATQPVTCIKVKDWDSTLNGYNVWALCPKGYYLNGLRLGRGLPAFLSGIDEGQCCRPQNHPDSYEDCYDEDVTLSFDNKGWSLCQRNGYYMTGFYKSDCDKLYCIETFRCCKMNEVGSTNASFVINGGWSDFGDWSECSVPCGGGIQERRRTCTSPPPSNGGNCCVGDNMEARSCNAQSCDEEVEETTLCPDGWVRHEYSCYLIIDTPTVHRSNARTKCQQFGADLAKITSATQNQFIFDLLRKQNTLTVYGVWLGLHRKADMKFYWADGTPLTGYTEWGAAQPSRLDEKCGHMIGLGSNRGKWNDIRCTFPIEFHPSTAPVILCQKTPSWPTILGN